MQNVILQEVHSRSAPSGVLEDVAVTTHHWRTASPGWETADFVALENAATTFWGAIQGYRHTSYDLSQHRWYVIPAAGGPTGDPVRVSNTTQPGTSANVELPPQVSITVTERTAERKRWGRFYLPGLTHNVIGVDGRVLAVAQTEIVQAAAAWMETGLGHVVELTPIVYRRIDNTWGDVTQLQVDDIFDVQRRRRYENVLNRQTVVLST